MIFTRKWAMPNHETFSIKPIGCFVDRYMGLIEKHTGKKQISIDPFARDCDIATFTNDLNPETKAQYHDDVLVFLGKLKEKNIIADTVLFDPPYSLRQMKEMYQGIGIDKLTMADTQRAGRWGGEKNIIAELLSKDGTVLSFGWHSNGMGKKRGFEIVEILLVSHGSAHNDTICIAEQRVSLF